MSGSAESTAALKPDLAYGGNATPAGPDLSINALFGVSGKTAVVTGGGSGVGYMMASAFAANGVKVIIASRKEKELQKATKQLNDQFPGSTSYVVADLGSKAGCDSMVAEIKKRVSKLHILVNNS
jgi:short-subunit dehydrogenase